MKMGGKRQEKKSFLHYIKQRRKLLSVVIIVALLIAGLCLGYQAGRKKPASRKENGVLQLEFTAGDRLQGYTVFDDNGKEKDISEVAGKSTLYIFAMKGCEDCRKQFPSYEILYSLFNGTDFKVVFVWDDEIPQKELSEINIPAYASYTAKGKYKFTSWVPTYFIVNEKNEIEHSSTEIEILAKTLKNKYRDAMNLNMFFDGGQIFAGIERCAACQSVYKQLRNGEIKYKYFIEGEYTEKKKDVYKDPEKLLSIFFDLTEFPVCLSMDSGGNIVKSEPLYE